MRPKRYVGTYGILVALVGRMKAEIILRALRTAKDHSQAFVSEFKAQGLDPSMYHQEEERLKLYNAALKAYSEEPEA